MDRAGTSAAVALTFTGRAALDPCAAAPLDVDTGADDPLGIDPAADPLLAAAAVLWTGRAASETP